MPYKDGWDLGKFAGAMFGLLQWVVFIFLMWIILYLGICIYETNTIVKDIQKTLKDKGK
jgi:hypothetical protein